MKFLLPFLSMLVISHTPAMAENQKVTAFRDSLASLRNVLSTHLDHISVQIDHMDESDKQALLNTDGPVVLQLTDAVLKSLDGQVEPALDAIVTRMGGTMHGGENTQNLLDAIKSVEEKANNPE